VAVHRKSSGVVVLGPLNATVPLGGLDLGVTYAVHDGLEVGAAASANLIVSIDSQPADLSG
jgi:hypothetical protein